MTRGTWTAFAWQGLLAALAASALAAGCSDDGNGGTPDAAPDDAMSNMEAGPDEAGPDEAGPGEGGTDGGNGSSTANVRFAHLIPGAPDVQLCIATIVGGSQRATLGPFPGESSSPNALPFRMVSPYLPTFVVDAEIEEYEIRVFDQADITSDSCPSGGTGALLTSTIPADQIGQGAYHTVMVQGMMGSSENPPSVQVVQESAMLPDSGMTKVRFAHAIPNLSSDEVDVCYDPDGDTSSGGDTTLIGGDNGPFDDVSFGDVNDYVMRMPITDGTISITEPGVVAGLGDCGDSLPGDGNPDNIILEVDVPFFASPPFPGAMGTLAENLVLTVFASGDATAGGSDTGPQLIPMVDAETNQ